MPFTEIRNAERKQGLIKIYLGHVKFQLSHLSSNTNGWSYLLLSSTGCEESSNTGWDTGMRGCSLKGTEGVKCAHCGE